MKASTKGRVTHAGTQEYSFVHPSTPLPLSPYSIDMGIIASVFNKILCLHPNNEENEQQSGSYRRDSTPFFSSSGPLDNLSPNESTYNSPTSTTLSHTSPSIVTSDRSSSFDGSISSSHIAPPKRLEIIPYPFLSTPAEYFPGSQPLPIVLATCIARSTHHGNFPSVYLYKQDPRNPIVFCPMAMWLRETGSEEGDKIRCRVVAVRSINRVSVEFWMTTRMGGFLQPAYIIVPLARVSLSRKQSQAHLNDQLWISKTIENTARYQAALEYTKGHYQEIAGKSSSMPNLISGIPFSPLEAPLPVYHRTVQPQTELRRL